MANKERYQNPVIGDDVRLRLLTFNNNSPANVTEVKKVDIYFLDPTEKTESNPYGKRLVETLGSDRVVQEDTGEYSVIVNLEDQKYTIGKYCDVWTIVVRADEPPATIENGWQIYPELWYASPIPVVYDFNFSFRPNKIRKGECKYIIISIEPNVPRASDLERYYQNLIIVSNLKISIEQNCGPCLPQEKDLRLVVDREDVDEREACVGYYKINTKEMDCGIYDVWFELELGGNCYISDKNQLQIYK